MSEKYSWGDIWLYTLVVFLIIGIILFEYEIIRDEYLVGLFVSGGGFFFSLREDLDRLA